jgi:SAM-dependent methyltransferase
VSGFTGERVIPGEVDVDLLNEHLARYAFATRLARGKRVLDAGCGAGYGSARLASQSRRVIGLDVAAEAVHLARERYPVANVDFLRADCRSLPFPDGSFDLVVAFEVIEHLEAWDRLLAESRRVLAPWGALVVSTPNRLYYGEQREVPNPFHVHEFDYAEFREALEQHYGHVRIFLENHTDSVVFAPADPAGVETAIEALAADPDGSHFFVAVCSPRPLHGGPAFVYVPQAANVLRERGRHIALLEDELEQKTRWLEETQLALDELHRRHQALEQEAAEDKLRAQEIILGLEEENAKKTAWNQETQQELDRIKGLLESLRAEFEERTRWAMQLETERAELDANYRILAEKEDQVRRDLKACVDQLHATEAELEARTAWAQGLEREVGELRQRVSVLTESLAALLGSPAYRIGKRLGLAPEVHGA